MKERLRAHSMPSGFGKWGNQLTVNPETFWLARPLTLRTAYTCPPTATLNLKEAYSPANSFKESQPMHQSTVPSSFY